MVTQRTCAILDLGEDRVDRRVLELASVALVRSKVDNLVVVNDQSVAGRALTKVLGAQVDRRAESLGEGQVNVGGEDDLVLGVVEVAPGGCRLAYRNGRVVHTHDEGVVRRNDVHGVDALGLELIHALHKRGDVLLVADGGVGTRDRDDHDLLALPLVAGLEGGGDTTHLTRVELRGPGDVAHEGVGDLVTLGSSSRILLVSMRATSQYLHQAL